MLLPKTGRD